MSRPTSDIAFTPSVKSMQRKYGSRASYERLESHGGWSTNIDERLANFLRDADMFYFGTATAAGQPYIQYRGGPPGFLKPLDHSLLGFADYPGNRQYISVGNLSENRQAFIFLMDYENQRRIKLWGNAFVAEEALQQKYQHLFIDQSASLERLIIFELAAWDINCPKHIHPRIPYDKVVQQQRHLTERVTELEKQLAEANAALRVNQNEPG